MIVKASQTYVRCSQQKLRDVARSIKGLTLTDTRVQLARMNKEAARRILQTLDQAVANANHNFGADEKTLSIDTILILRGPHFKRFRAVSRGTAHAILKRTAHIVVTVKTGEEKTAQQADKATEVKAAELEGQAVETTSGVATPKKKSTAGKRTASKKTKTE